MCSASRGRMGISSDLIPDLDVSSRQQESDRLVMMGLETH